jgi:Protein of unknown function (DUF3014)
MSDLPDLELQRHGAADQPAGVRSTSSAGMRVGWAALALLLAFAAYVAFFWTPRNSRVGGAAPAASAAAPTPSKSVVINTVDQPIALPPLDQTDAIVRSLIAALTRDPLVARWLSTSGLIRTFAVVVTNIADGQTPAKHLRVLTPDRPFQITERGGAIFVDPASYHRYDGFARALSDVEPAGAARLYGQLKPRIEDAYRQLGVENRSLDETVIAALGRLLDTPIVDGPIRLQPKGISYRYADDRLEDLTSAQRQLLRTGPDNTKSIQASLRRIAAALGIPEEALSGSRPHN